MLLTCAHHTYGWVCLLFSHTHTDTLSPHRFEFCPHSVLNVWCACERQSGKGSASMDVYECLLLFLLSVYISTIFFPIPFERWEFRFKIFRVLTWLHVIIQKHTLSLYWPQGHFQWINAASKWIFLRLNVGKKTTPKRLRDFSCLCTVKFPLVSVNVSQGLVRLKWMWMSRASPAHRSSVVRQCCSTLHISPCGKTTLRTSMRT